MRRPSIEEKFVNTQEASTEELQRRTLTAFSAAWDAGDVDTLLSLMSDNPVYRGSTGPEALVLKVP